MDPQAMKQLVFAALLCALAACHPAPSEPVAATLIESHPKAGFDFATSRPVEVRISAASRGALRLTTQDGHLLFSGTLDPRVPLKLKLPIASAESKLLAELRDAEGKATAVDLPIVGGSAVHAFN
jgi:hypothetical protein